jgi:hypothetical protein
MATTERTAAEAGDLLEGALKNVKNGSSITVADAATAAGIPLRHAELGLRHLSTKYRGMLSVTDDGQLLHRFPYGFSLPLLKQPWWRRTVDKVKGAVLGVGRFVVRAWVSIVLVGYAAVFLAFALAMMLGSREGRGGGAAVYFLLRLISEALWWTFHPFSPVARRNIYDDRRQIYENFDDPDETKIPFYEKVNRFVFGPTAEKPDEQAQMQRILAAIRAGKGRIGIVDVLKVTGLPREEADPLMSKLMLDYDGDVDVGDDAGITYRFPDIRKTAGADIGRAPAPVWQEILRPLPVTGNDSGANTLVAAINGFNVVMALVAMNMNMTVARFIDMLSHFKSRVPVPPLPYDGIPLVLGVIPFVFSTLLFAMPLYRWATSNGRMEKVDTENGRRAVLKSVLDQLQKNVDGGVREDDVKRAWKKATGKDVDDSELTRELVKLGADVDMDAMAQQKGVYRFRDLEAEIKEVQKQRAQADVAEERVGHVVFKTDA